MLLQAHSGFRYLVLLAGIIVILYAAYGLATKRKYGTRMRVLSGVFTGIVDLTAVLGLLVVIFYTNFYTQLTGHILMMVLAVVTAHVVHGVMKRRPQQDKSFTPHIFGTLIVMACIVAGIMAIGRPIIG